MGWIHRAPEAPQHVCYPPMREAVHRWRPARLGQRIRYHIAAWRTALTDARPGIAP